MKKQLLAVITFGLVWLLIGIIIALPASVTAQPPPPGVGEIKARSWTGELPPVVGPSPAREAPASPSTTADTSPGLSTGLPDWSRTAFQSYRDENWEIYLARGDGSQPTRLTNHPAADTRPRLNRGATRLAFTSNRDGNSEIYTMNAGGSGLTRLTANDASEAGPVWSPDGSRIAFASDQDGNAEIYVMNADGSAQTRRTHDGAVDFMPTWSPDGRQIAWVRRDGIEGALWVMNADGSNPHALTGTLRFPQNPAWSPDGSRIAFDYDADGDVWNELVVINADGTGLHTVYDPGATLVDAWMGSWSPDGEWLSFSRVEYVVQDDELYLRNTYVERVPPAGGSVERLLPLGVDLLPDWQTTDISPPQVHLERLPRYLRSPHGAITLSWSGEDMGPAGLGGYEVEKWEEDLGYWATWIWDTQDTTAHFAGTPGKTYAFRVRARDNAWNVSPWSGGLWNRTTLYAWHLTGTVSDNRDIPLSGAVVETTPPSINTAFSGFDGRFRVYQAEMATTTVSVRLQGYGELPPAAFSGAQDAVHWWGLPPTDDQLVNGGFEQETLTPWQPGGSSPVTLDWTVAHTGDVSARLGQPPTLEITSISNNRISGLYGPPRIAADTAGNLHVTWSEISVFHRMRPPGGDWTPPVTIASQHPGVSLQPELAIGSDGTVHVVWLERIPGTDQDKIGYTFKPPGGTWSAMYDLSDSFPTPTRPLFRPTPIITVDGQGGLHVVWSDGEGIWYTVKRRGESWSSPVEVFPTGDMPTLAIGPDDQIHLVWRERNSGDMLYSHRSPDSPWSPPINLTGHSGIRYGPHLTVDPQGRLHLVWIDATHHPRAVFYVNRSTDGNWSVPISVADDDDTAPTTVYLVASPEGRLHMAWAAMDRLNNLWTEVHYRTRSPDGPWSAPVLIPRDQPRAEGPALWADESGLAHLVWYEGLTAGNKRVMYTQVNLARATEASLSQTVALPSNLHRPTLSFAYMLDVAAGTGAYLDAEVNGTPVFSTTVPTADWTHAWANLSAWAGQTVTLSFNASSTPTSGPVIAHLDSVSLGSWFTPLVHSVSPAHVETWPASITITGENFIATPAVRLNETPLSNVQWVDDGTLRAALPASLPPGVYDVWVTNPGGQESVLPRGLRIGKQVYLPTVFRQYTP